MKILHLEDNPPDAELVSALLHEEWPDCAIDAASTREDFIRHLEKNVYDIVLSDFHLGGFDGLEALKIVRARAPHTPFIFVSGTIGEDAAIAAVQAGAQDYVLKDRIRRLVAAIPRALSDNRENKERRLTEEANRQLVSVLETTPDFVGMMNLDGRTFYINRAGQRMLALRDGEDPGMLAIRDFYPADVARWIVREAIPTAVRNGTWTGETTLLTRRGELIPVSQVIIAHKSAEGSVQYLSTIMRDITTRKAAESRINEQADLINKAHDAIIVTDLAGRITFWNQGAERITGYKVREATGQTIEGIFGPDCRPQLEAERQALEKADEWRGELRMVNKQGRPLILEASVSLIRDEAKKPKARLAIISDITEKKSLEEQFLRAQRLESIGMLAAGIAHDLNNVLAPILMVAPMLRERATDPGDLRMLETLEKSAERGASLVRQILSFASGSEGGPQIVQVKHLIRDLAEMMTETLPKNIRLDVDMAVEPWPVNASATQIHQVLLNLCVNARDAMPNGGTLRLRAENRVLDALAASAFEGATPGDWLILHVEDTGTGIPPEVLSHIWDPFYTTKDANKGTGLGLSTVRGIVANHGGFVTLATAPGRGTTFRVHLPALKAGSENSLHHTSNPFLPRGDGELILIADDETTIRDVTAATLARHGYRVLLAGDGTEAVALFAPRSGDVSLVITDLGMPNLDGAAFAGVVRHLNPAVKILVISGHEIHEGTGPQPKRFSDAFLLKPFKAEALLLAVHELLHPPAASPG